MKESVYYKSIKNLVEKIRKIAHENTDLFLGIGGWVAPVGAVVAAVIMYCINWAVYCYEFGYYHLGFNVPISLIKEPTVTNWPTSVIGCFFLVIVLLITKLIGRWAYRKRKYLLFFFAELLVISIAVLCPLIPSLVDMNGVEALTAIVTCLLLAVFFTVLLNVFSFSFLIFPSKEDVLARKEVELRHLEKQQDVYEKKKKSVEEKINELEKQTESKEKVTPKEVVKETLIMVLITVFAFLISGIPACVSMGINEVMQKDELTLVMNAEEVYNQFREILAEDCAINGVAIIYETNDGVLVSPCYVGNGEVIVYTSFQQFIDAEGLIVYTDTYERIIPKTVALSFNDSIESNVDGGNLREE